ncbi:MAG: multidrug effflux MFS transporter [Micrococcales bacterium]|nr:multidrug effflux MFS transporter [Micrococcales bacterium]
MSERARPRAGRLLIPALVVVTGIGPFATDTYISALPALAGSLHTTGALAQLTLTAFIVGLALGQLACGPVSDAVGRRRMLLASTAAFALSSLVCALAPAIGVLLAMRVVQGLAAGTGVVVGRAVVTDSYGSGDAAKTYGTLASITFLAPLIAPVAGRLIMADGTWRTVFYWLAAAGVLMVAAVLVGIPETLPPQRRHPPGLGQTLRRMGELSRDWSFMQHVAVNGLATAGFFTYIGGSSFVLQSSYGISESLYAVVFATNAAAMALSSIAFRALVGHRGPRWLRTVGVGVSTAAAVGLLVVALLDRDGSLPIAVPWAMLCLIVGGGGLTIPSTTALAQEAGRRMAGTAASLQGGLSMLIGAICTPLTGLFGYDSLLPMAAMMAAFYGLSCALMRRLARR